GWLDAPEGGGLQQIIDDEQRHVTHIRDYRAAFADSRVWIFCFQFLAWSLGIYGLNSWLAVVIKNASGLSIRATGFLEMVPYLFGMILMLGISVWSDRMLVRKAFVWPFMFIGAAAFGMSYVAGHNHFWWAFAGIVTACACMYAPYGPFWAMVPEMVSRNVAGESMALINTMGAAGGLIGTWGVGELNYATHGPGAGFICMGGALVLAGILTLMLHAQRPDIAS
ncbi:MAG TPA: MFS transporter, partial [Tepidisphaeraceae bacterium]|nr:MFS transporter [Tepidisphaeraceae bacterium]